MFADMTDGYEEHPFQAGDLVAHGLSGLRNLGNTCYMNAALQALFNCPQLTEFILECHRVLDPHSRNVLFTHYLSLLCDIWRSERPRCFNAVNLLDAFCMIHPIFRGYSQHDAQEFLRLFLVQLHEELVYPNFSDAEKRGPKQIASSTTESKSIITDVFQGRLVSTVRCLSCNRLSNREESFMDLSLSLAKPSSCITSAPLSSPTVVQSSSKIPTTTPLPSYLMNGNICTDSSILNGPIHVKTVNHQSPLCLSSSSNSSKSPTTSKYFSSRRFSIMRRWSSASNLPVIGHLVTVIPWLLTILFTFAHVLLTHLRNYIPSPRKWIDRWSNLTLEECLAHYFSEAELVGENKYFCTRCNQKRNGIKQFRLLALPEILTLHLKRFSNSHVYSSKLLSPVSFPLRKLELRPYMHRECTDKFATASGSIFGAIITLYANATITGWSTVWILPFTAGGFLYIALVSLVPDLLKELSVKESLIHFALMIIGLSSMAIISLALDT